jgi:catechol 2,3-dioxygenase-like lactoylglutathione lyase family enzyme
MLDHVTIRSADPAASEAFYDTVLPVVGRGKTYAGDDFVEWDDFSLTAPDRSHPVTRRLHIAFFARRREDVDEFWRVGTDAGYADDGQPGLRPQYGPDYYGGFLLDPDGNSVEAVSRETTMKRGAIDHMWIRVEDLTRAREFYAALAPYTGFHVDEDGSELVRFKSADGATFSVLGGEPTEQLHLAFSAATNEVVDTFHRTALAAGYRDNGAPGERPVYHDGYYAAFVLDPDGNNVELVNHNRGQ